MSLHGLNPGMLRDVTSLPEPDAAALAHSDKLVQFIRDEIREHGGRISFDRYMEIALHEPGLGYYSAGSRKIGREGDFVTAPELSSLFSICLARQCRQILADLPHGVIMELGAGSGRMACDLLQELQRTECLPASYLILETSADLRQRQRQLIQEQIPELSSRIEWLDRLPERPVAGVVLANEVMDALPVHRLASRDNRLYELHVTCQDGGFGWLEVPAAPALNKQARDIMHSLPEPWPEGYTTEISTAIDPWTASLAGVLQQGVMILIDYGYTRSEYYHPQRTDGTLLCHYRHRVHADPFFHPGLQDITASVDFTAVAEAAVNAGLSLCGFTNQAYFLLGCGLDEILSSYIGGDQKQYLELAGQVKILTLPGEMGERFKVIALGKEINTRLIGFSTDHRRRL